MHPWWNSVGKKDVEQVTTQLGKEPRGILAIARRCRFGSPQVVVTSPVVYGPGRRSERKAGVTVGDIRVFPTTYWLTCPYLAAAVGRIEGQGWVSRLGDWISDEKRMFLMEGAHKRAATERLSLVPPELQEQLRVEQPAQWDVLVSAGIGGARAYTGVKCLHSHLADYLAGPVGAERVMNSNVINHMACSAESNKAIGNRNLVGARVLSLLLQAGTDISGWPGCRGCQHTPSLDSPVSEVERIDVIDVGTNSCRLLCTRIVESALESTATDLRTTRLGEGLQLSGQLAPQAVHRTVTGLQQLLDHAHSTEKVVQHATQTVAVATNAVRSAANAEEFLVAAWERLGLPIRVVKGEEEAELSFQGALSGLRKVNRQHSLGTVSVLDIGGGSTELVVGEWDGAVVWSGSVGLGAVRLTELARHKEAATVGEPYTWEVPGLEELAWMAHTAESYLTQGYPQTQRRFVNQGALVGVGGTCTTLAAIDMRMSSYDSNRVQGYELSATRIAQLATELTTMPLDERKKVPGLQPERADIIVAGAAILLAAMRLLGKERLLVSDTDILLGVAYQFYKACLQTKNEV